MEEPNDTFYNDRLTRVLDYHQRSKHHMQRYAKAPPFMDWATQPDPFRRYLGSDLVALSHPPLTSTPDYGDIFQSGRIAPAALNRDSISQLFRDSLSISAWKQAGDTRWALRVNPSSGNLHPTEGYLLCGPVEQLFDTAVVCHYAPREHALEVRARFDLALWQALTRQLPQHTVLLGLSSIHWREAWKYGERAYRYCQHDVGHAIAAVSIAAAGLGWQVRLLDHLGTSQIAELLGLGDDNRGVDPERPDCLLAVFPRTAPLESADVPNDACQHFRDLTWFGQANQLGPQHRDWPIIDAVSSATDKPRTKNPNASVLSGSTLVPEDTGAERTPIPLRGLIHQRRSAVAMDGVTHLARDAFYSLLQRLLAVADRPPLSALPCCNRVNLLLFVHRVTGVDPGLYMLVRNSAHLQPLQQLCNSEFDWQVPAYCPAGLPLYHLLGGDAREASKQLSCHQDIAADGCFSLGMVAEFDGPLKEFGPWYYSRLFWECGVIGQLLYLEAQAAGIRATGIGCYFDDGVHQLLGLEGTQFQCLYHFTLGGALDDARLQTLEAYDR